MPVSPTADWLDQLPRRPGPTDDTDYIKNPTNGLWYVVPTTRQATPLPAPEPAQNEPNWFDSAFEPIKTTLIDPAYAGFQQAQQTGDVLGRGAGLFSDESTAEGIAEHEKQIPAQAPFRREFAQDLASSDGFLGALGSYVTHPRAVLANLVQSLSEGAVGMGLTTGAGTAGGFAGGLATPLPGGAAVGAAVGTVAGAGLTGAAQGYGNAVIQTIRASGVNMADKRAVQQALQDPTLMAQANEAARKAGVSEGLINALSMGIAGRVFKYGKALAPAEKQLTGVALGAGAEGLAQGTIGAGGEALRQEYDQGQITDPSSVVGAGINQVAMGAGFAGIHSLLKIRTEKSAFEDTLDNLSAKYRDQSRMPDGEPVVPMRLSTDEGGTGAMPGGPGGPVPRPGGAGPESSFPQDIQDMVGAARDAGAEPAHVDLVIDALSRGRITPDTAREALAGITRVAKGAPRTETTDEAASQASPGAAPEEPAARPAAQPAEASAPQKMSDLVGAAKKAGVPAEEIAPITSSLLRNQITPEDARQALQDAIGRATAAAQAKTKPAAQPAQESSQRPQATPDQAQQQTKQAAAPTAPESPPEPTAPQAKTATAQPPQPRRTINLPQDQEAPAPQTQYEDSPAGRLSQQIDADPAKARADYAAIEGTEGGRILSPDKAKFLSTEYQGDRTLSDSLGPTAGRFVQAMYNEKLKEAPGPGQTNDVVLTSGGTGSGKTSAVEGNDARQKAQIVYDTNLSNLDVAKRRINQALSAGKDVTIMHVYREPGEAYENGVIPRALGSEGRPVTVANHARTHADSNAVVRQLAREYADDPRVHILAVDNSHGHGNQRLIPMDQVPSLEHHPTRELAQSKLDDAFRSGRLPENLYRASGGKLPASEIQAAQWPDVRPAGGGEPAPQDTGDTGSAGQGQREEVTPAAVEPLRETKPRSSPLDAHDQKIARQIAAINAAAADGRRGALTMPTIASGKKVDALASLNRYEAGLNADGWFKGEHGWSKEGHRIKIVMRGLRTAPRIKYAGKAVAYAAPGQERPEDDYDLEKINQSLNDNRAAPEDQPGESYPDADPSVKFPNVPVETARLMADPLVADAMLNMAGEVGWYQIGGRMTRQEAKFQGQGNEYIIGRTKWIPHAPWFAEHDERLAHAEESYPRVVRAALAGKRLGAKEQRVITLMAYSARDRVYGRDEDGNQDEEAFAAHVERLERMQQSVDGEQSQDEYDREWAALRKRTEEEIDAIFRRESEAEALENANAAADEGRQGGHRADHERVAPPTAETAIASDGRDGSEAQKTQGSAGGARSEAGDGPAVAEPSPLSSYAEGDLALRERAIKNREADEREANVRAKVDQERDQFALTGSDRPSDTNPAQRDIFTHVDSGQVREDASEYGKVSPVPDQSGNLDRQRQGSVAERGEDNGTTTGRRAATPIRHQLDIFSPLSNAKPARQAAKLLSRTAQVAVGNFRTGISHVQKWQDAAHIVAPLRKSAVEQVLAVALGKDGKVLAVLRHTIGDLDGSSVYVSTLNNGLTQIEGVRSVYYAHNHPSGNLNPSNADILITEKLASALEGSGVTPMGMIIVAPNSTKATFFPPGSGHVTGEMTKAARSLSVPITERRFTKIRTGKTVSVESPMEMSRALEQTGEKSGILLLDNYHRLAGVLPMRDAEMLALRHDEDGDGEPTDSGAAAIMRAVADSNAKAIIPFGTAEGTTNVANFAQHADILSIDRAIRSEDGTFTSGGSGSRRGAFFARGTSARADHYAQQVHDALDDIARGADEAPLRDIRPDLAEYGGGSDIWLKWGGDNAGLQKILNRRGPDVLSRVLRTLADGSVERVSESNQRLVLKLGTARAVLSLDDHGSRKSWLLTGWIEGRPDATKEVRTASEATQRGPTFGRSELGAGLDDIVRQMGADPQLLLRRSTDGEAGARDSRQEVTRFLGRVKDALDGIADVHVHETPAEASKATGIDVPEDARGFYSLDDGSAHFVLSNLPNAELAQHTFVHEVMGHLAMERFPEFAKAIDMARKLHSMGGLKDIWNEVGRTHPGASELTHVKEVIAAMAERGVKNSIMDRLIAAVKDFLRRVGVNLKYSERELRALIARAARAMHEKVRNLASEDLASARAADKAMRSGDEATASEALGKIMPESEAIDALSQAKAKGDKASIRALTRISAPMPEPSEALFAENAAPFYSALTQAVQNFRQLRASPEQWLAMIKNAKGIKPEELEWNGVQDWLREQRGPVTRERLLDHVRRNEVQVEEVLHEKPEYPALDTRDIDRIHYALRDEYGEGLSQRESDILERGGPEAAALIDQLRTERGLDPALAPVAEGPSTKFHDYVAPGGENYKELLLTLPERGQHVAPTFKQWWHETHVSMPVPEPGTRLYEVAQRDYERDAPNLARNADRYESPHWAEPNVLAHVRFDEREDGDGNRVLHLAEIQSDWHQQGRKLGYRQPTQYPEPLTELPPGYRAKVEENEHGSRAVRVLDPDGYAVVVRTLQSGDTSEIIERKAIESLNAQRLSQAEAGGSGRAPQAPFKTTWPELAVKRMIRYAAENGFDRLTWDTGETQADRYDLSKRIATVRWDGSSLAALGHDGLEVVGANDIAPDRLPDYIGKEAADRLLAQTPDQGVRTLAGEDLKVGGEGMRGFYDKILPATVNKYVKKWGGKVERSSLDLPEGYEPDIMNGEEEPTANDQLPVHSLTITPEMKRMALAGQPLFARSMPSHEDAMRPVDGQIPDRVLFARQAPMDKATQEVKDRVLNRDGREGLGLMDRLRLGVQAIKNIDKLSLLQGIVDDLASLERYERMLNGGQELPGEASPTKMSRGTRNIASVMTAVLKYGAPEWKDGAFQIVPGRRGLIDIFKPLANHPDGSILPHFELYAAARRAARLITEKNRDGTLREKNFTQADIDTALKLGKQYPELETAFRQWNQFNKQILDIAQAAGIIDPVARARWEHNDYVPFYRAMDDASGVRAPFSVRGLMNQRAKIRALHGEAAPINNVLENMMMNVTHLLNASAKNHAAQAIAQMLDGVAMQREPMAVQAVKFTNDQIRRALASAGIAVDPHISQEQLDEWATLFRRVAPTGPDITSVMVGGKPVYYRVLDPMLMDSISSLAGSNNWLKMLDAFGWISGPKNLLTRASTWTPRFLAANFIRDTVATWLQTDLHVGIVKNAGSGFLDSVKDHQDLYRIMMAGGGGGQRWDSDPTAVRSLLMHDINARDVDGFMSTVASPKKWWSLYDRVGRASENANRLRVFRQALQQGKSVAEAAYQARDVLDFAMHGAHPLMQLINRAVPFINARIQGAYRAGRGFRDNWRAYAMRGGLVAAATLALYALNYKNKKYQELPEWEKDMFWHIYAGPVHVRIPRPFELGAIFATIPERMARAADHVFGGKGGDTLSESKDAFIRMLSDTFAINPTPQAIRPLVEQYANRDMFTGRPIVGQAQQGDLPEHQYTPYTSPTVIEGAKLLPDSAPLWLKSPERLQHLFQAYTSTFGQVMLNGADWLTRRGLGYSDAPSKPMMQTALNFFVRSGEPQTTKFSDRIYDMLNESNQVFKTINDYAKEGRMDDARRLIKDKQAQLELRPMLNDLGKQLRELSAQQRDIMSLQGMSADRKRELIDQLTLERNNIARQVAPYEDMF